MLFRICIATASLIFASNAFALNAKRVSFPNSFPGYVKVYVSPTEGAADVLFMVDNSGSMETYQSQLKSNIPALTQALAKASISVQTAVVTTDMDSWSQNVPGKFVGTPAVLDSTSPTFEADLTSRMMVGTTGSSIEQPFASILTSLSAPLITADNAGFLRSDARLVVFMVTDAEDQSPTTSDEMVTFLKGLKGNAGVSVFGAIIPSSEVACSRDEGKPTKIEDFLAKMNGQTKNLCAPDWGSSLNDFAKDLVLKIAQTIQLPGTPEVSSIEVTYGSMTLVKDDMHLGWHYDTVQNAVILGDQIDWSTQAKGTELQIKFIPSYWY